MIQSAAEILREYGPFPGVDSVHGVTYDGQHVWFAAGDKLHAFDPASGKTLRSIDVAAHAGTAFDGQHLFQIAEDRIQKIDPQTGRVLATIPAPGGGGDSGLAWAEGTLWVGQSRDRKIHQIDPQTGAILRTIASNRFVTGVTWIDGELWHGTWEGDESDVRRVDPRTGEVLERLEMPPGVGVSGLESDGGEQFFCGGGSSGKVRTVRRPRPGSAITAAARALAAGDPLGALNRVALCDDAPALALRGIAMARLGDLVRAKALVRSAARAFGPKEAVARARCVVAEAEIALVSRDLGWPAKALDAARATLEAHGDRVNAAHARYLEARRLLLLGRLDEAERTLADLDPAPFPPASRAAHELVVAGIAMRRLRTKSARAALDRAARAARHARIPALTAEVESASLVLNTPAARLIARGEERLLLLEEVEALQASKALVVDACRHVVRDPRTVVSLARRPVLFALARALGEAWPGDVPRDRLVARAFGAKLADASHRARLRVEVGRLRTVLRALAGVSATKRGFALAPRHAREVVVLARPVEEQHAAVLAFLADGESWSSSALALALGASQRTVQRALDSLAAAGKVQSFGRGRARRWMTPPVPGFTTTLLLPAPLPSD